jgi:hypothetical protein
VRRQNEGSFGCEAVARELGQPNVPECGQVFRFSFLSFCSKLPFSLSFFQLAPNGLPLAAVGEIEALRCQPSTNVHRSTTLDLTTSAPLRQTAVMHRLYLS